MKRIVTVLFALLLCLWRPALAQENLLVNGSFEELNADGLPLGWETSAYWEAPGYTRFASAEGGQAGSLSVSIENFEYNDARFEQTVAVEPESLYCLSGYIQAEDIPDSGWGANLSISGITACSEGVFESDSWNYVEFYGETGPGQTTVTVYVRLGGYSGESRGRAWFDGIALEKVEAVPDEVIASLWYRDTAKEEPAADYSDDQPEGREGVCLPAWLWWTAALLLYAGLAWLMQPMLAGTGYELGREAQARENAWMALSLGAALLLRLAVAWKVPAYPVDMACFKSWGATMAQYGPGGFYANAGFCDYPPGYLYVLWLTAEGIRALGITGQTGVEMMYKLGPICFDLATAWLIYRGARGHKAGKAALAAGLLYAFNPAVILNGAAWGQVDSVLAFLLAAVVLLAVKGRWLLALPLFALAALVKPQALMMGPVGLCAFVMDWIRAARKEKQKGTHRTRLLALGACLGVFLLVALPFNGGRNLFVWLYELYGKTLSSYAYPTVNTANLYYLMGENWGALEGRVPLWLPLGLAGLCLCAAAWSWLKKGEAPLDWLGAGALAAGGLALAGLAVAGCTYGLMGTVLMVLAFCLVISQFLRGQKTANLPLMGANLLLLLYVFGVKMHERYLYPALMLWALAYLLNRDRRILRLMGGATVTLFVNSGIILDKALRLPSNQAHLNVGQPGWAAILAVLNLLLAFYGVYVGGRICAGGEIRAIPAPSRFLLRVDRARQSLLTPTDHRLHMKARDYWLMGGVTLIYSVVALWNLGSTAAPQTTWQSTAAGEQVVFDLGKATDFKTLYYCQVSYNNFSLAVSEDGAHWSQEYPAEMDEWQNFRWKYVMQSSGAEISSASFSQTPLVLHGRYVRLTAQQVGLKVSEMVFRDGEGSRLTPVIQGVYGTRERSGLAGDPSLIIDEQDTLRGEPSWYNGFYFDEIYHARTAYEHAHAWDGDAVFPRETSHPPLGKVMMSWSILVFGMTPFGWRFAGALMGILMLPAMYLLGRQLFKRRDLAAAVMLLMAFDCMHLTQTRIATIDSFPVLFIILAFFFMLRFMQTDTWAVPLRTTLWPLLGSGVCMGLAIASKWIGVYAGVGLAVLYFWTCARRLAEHCRAKRMNLEEVPEERRGAVERAARCGFSIVLRQCLACLVFFIAIPLGIYYASYIPYFASTGGVTVEKVIEAAVGKADANGVRSGGMLGYHSTPGLGMDHPYYSPWWEWPLIMKPMWFASSNDLLIPEGMDYSIFCMGNPGVWWMGLAGLLFVLIAWVKRHVYLTAPAQGRLRLHPQGDDRKYAFLLIAFAAQFMPWVLVPRGTYIYHYFASVPFIVCCAVAMLSAVRGKRGMRLLWAYVALCGGLFLLFYPYASGEIVSTAWLDAPKALMNWAYSHPEWPQWLRGLFTWFPKIYY